MIVHTHYESTSVFPKGDAIMLLEAWRAGWEKRGFTCIVTGRGFIESRMDNALVSSFIAKVDGFPSVNPLGFDRASFIRWLATYLVAEKTGCAVACAEGDVMNYGFTPSSLIGMDEGILNVGDRDGCPCVAFSNADGYGRLVEAILKHEVNENDHYQGNKHLSDQDFIMRYYSQTNQYNSFKESVGSVFMDGWADAPLVHFGTPFFMLANVPYNQKPKYQWIEELKPIL